jgi:predicted RNA-binding Zn ribbon-like protein
MPETSLLVPPDAATRLLAFVNTHAGGQAELLGDAAGLHAWLARAGYGALEVGDADAASARELRDALQVVLLAHGDEATAGLADAEQVLHRVAPRYPLASVVGAHAVTLVPVRDGLDGALGSLLADVAMLARSGAWERLRACRNAPCRLGFYDRTRNGSAMYHGPGCSSMASMRAYRARKRRAV